jgi:hypothetical protein
MLHGVGARLDHGHAHLRAGVLVELHALADGDRDAVEHGQEFQAAGELERDRLGDRGV